jgi:branched-chain amino acid transport system substrate-binding protein
LRNAFAAGYLSTTYDAKGKLPSRTQALMDKIRPKLGKGEIDFMFWWIALGYDAVKIVEHAVKTAGSTDAAAIGKVLENTKDFPGVYATYSWSKENARLPRSQYRDEHRRQLQGWKLLAAPR